MDEERRLFYVVVTRAKDELYMFTPQMQKTAQGGVFPVDPSLFVKEIPPELADRRRIYSPPPVYSDRRYGRNYF